MFAGRSTSYERKKREEVNEPINLVINNAELTGGGIHDTNRKPCNNNEIDDDDAAAASVTGSSTTVNSSRLGGRPDTDDAETPSCNYIHKVKQF